MIPVPAGHRPHRLRRDQWYRRRRDARTAAPTHLALAAGAAVVVVLAVSGCSASGGDTASGPATIQDGSTTSAVSSGQCGSVEPGIAVDASKAVVFFDTESVCPGWVTVEQGTPVTFHNDGSAPTTVVVTASQLPDSAEVARFTVQPGAGQPLDTRDVAMMGFSVDSLPGFRGTVEVVAPGGAMQH